MGTAERVTWSKVGIGSRADTWSPLGADKISLFLMTRALGVRQKDITHLHQHPPYRR